jgi:type I restriction enzyme S subunit
MNWSEVTFETLYATPSRNGIYKSSEFHGSGCRIVNMGELFGFDFISSQEMKRVELNDAERAINSLEDGDLLFGRRSLVEAGAGKCSIVVDPPEPLTFESSIIRVRLDRDAVNPFFFYYYFRSPQGRGRIRSIVSGTNVKGIRSSDLKRLLVETPQKNVQDQIADALSRYDNLIENNRRRMTLLEQAAGLLYREWYVRLRFPGYEHVPIHAGIPDGWAKRSIGELSSVTMGQSPESRFYNESGEGLPFHQGVADFGNRFTTNRIFTTALKRIAEGDDILCSVRAPVGRLNVTLDKIVIGRGLAALRSIEDSQSFLFYQLATHFFKEDLIGSGAIFASVTKHEFLSQKLLTPPSSMIRAFEDISRPIDAQIRVLFLQNENLRAARDLLLPRLMSRAIAF